MSDVDEALASPPSSSFSSSSSPSLSSSSSSPSPSPSPSPSALFPFSALTLTFPIVGRRHYSASPPSPTSFVFLREPHNPRDPLAIKAFHAALPTPALLPLGHVPARLSSSLSPLLDLTCLTLGTPTAAPPPSDDSPDPPLLISLPLHVDPTWLSPTLPPHLLQHSVRVGRHVRQLLQYVEWSGVDEVHRFIRNFHLVAESVGERFGHLLTEEEGRWLAAFRALAPASQHLYCRLMQRKQTPSPLMAEVISSLPSASSSPSSASSPPAPVVSRWFQVSALSYRQVPDVEAALQELLHPPFTQPPPPQSSPSDVDLPPEWTSPCKASATHQAVTFANIVPSSPFSASKLQGVEWDDLTPPCSPYKQPPTAVRRLMALEEQPAGEERASDDDVCGFVESSERSNLSSVAFYSSVFDSMTAAMLKDLCTRLDIRLRPSLSVAATKAALLQLMQKQRTMSGRCMLDDPRLRRTLHSLFGPFIRLSPRFLLLCQRLYRLFFLSEDVSHSSIASASSPMMLEDLGRARWAKPNPPASPSLSSSFAIFPTRNTFLAWDTSLQLQDCMAYAIDDFEAELRAGYVHTPLALACMEEAWVHLQHEREQPYDRSHLLPFTLIDRVRRMQATLKATASPHLFPTDYASFFTSFQPHSPAGLPLASTAPRPFVLRFRASSAYALVCHVGIHILEREHRYVEATTLLFRLLSLPYVPQRRGQWWNRLSLNLATHLACKKQAMAVCAQAMADDSVRTGDRVELQRRWYRLWKDKEGGNGLGLPPHVERWAVPLPSTAKRKAAAAKKAATAKDKRRRRSSCAALSQVKEEGEEEEDDVPISSLSRASSSFCSSHPSAAPPSLITQLTIQGRPTNREVGVKSHFYSAANDPCTVEELALEHYATLGYNGIHCENSLFLALFALLLWDQVWDGEVEGVWLCPYQSAPLDMDDDDWYARRRAKVERRLAELRAHPDLAEEVGRQWWSHCGERCRGMQWRAWTVEQLQTIVRCMSSEAIAGILGVMAGDYHHWGGGLPDLFLYRAEEGGGEEERRKVARRLHLDDIIVISSDDEGGGGKGGEDKRATAGGRSAQGEEGRRRERKAGMKGRCDDCVRLVEVKGPRDRLSSQQLAWLHVLAPFIPVEVCYVREDLETL